MVHNVRCILLFDVKNGTPEMDLIYGSGETEENMPGMLYGKLPFLKEPRYRQIVERDLSFSDHRWKTVSSGAQDEWVGGRGWKHSRS